MTEKKNKPFSKEYKAEVIDIVRRNDDNVAKTATALGLNKSRIYAWLKEAKDSGSSQTSGSISSAERSELAQLRREVKDLRMEREFLKKQQRGLRLRANEVLCNRCSTKHLPRFMDVLEA